MSAPRAPDIAPLLWPLPPLRLEVTLRSAARAGPPKRGCLSPTPAPSKKKQRCHATLPRQQPQKGGVKRPAQPAASAPCRQPRGVRGVERQAQPTASPPQKKSRPSEGEESKPPKKAKLLTRQPRGAERQAQPRSPQPAARQPRVLMLPATRLTARLRWLQSLLPIRQEAPESWLQRPVRADGSSRWGCKVCAVHAAKGLMGKGADGMMMRRISSQCQLPRFQLRPNAARLPHLRRHGQSQAHAVATKAYLSGGWWTAVLGQLCPTISVPYGTD